MTIDGQPQPASTHTQAANASVLGSLPFEDTSDFDRAQRGLLAAEDELVVTNAGGAVVWSQAQYGFVAGEAPDTVNPSLWRQARLNGIHGLFEVCDGIYQVRGYDLSNITFVRGEQGWIVIDPLTAVETARAALAFANQHLGERPVTAVIYTHSHVDHFAGVAGVTTRDDVASGRVRLIAPAGFLEAAVSENVIAGPAMTRRAMYMYGPLLPKSPTGQVDAGLGKTTPIGEWSLLAPTESITETGTELVVDGVRIEFQITPGTEAPAEMNFYFPDHRALCMAENCTANLHNVYTPRGAEIRDALGWSKYINEAIVRFADRSDVLFASHHWPRFGQDDLRGYLAVQRDTYRFIHDQTMRLANRGLTPLEIAEELALPPSLDREFHVRGYYGTVNHNVKAVYQKYLGWFDANPAHLHPHPPEEAARRYVAYMGGADAVVERARADYEAGDYRWVAEVVNHVVFADPDNRDARLLAAAALEQLGYQAESGPWRNFYLMGAAELRNGTLSGIPAMVPQPAMTSAMHTDMLFDWLAVRIRGAEADGRRVVIDIVLRDVGERWALTLEHGVLNHTPEVTSPDAALTLTTDRPTLEEVVTGRLALADALASGAAAAEGDPAALESVFALVDTFELFFPIVTP